MTASRIFGSVGLAAALWAGGPWMGATVSELELRADPADARVRPGETLVVQALAYALETGEDGGPRRVRLKREVSGARFETDCGWLSKPFRYQGPDDAGFEEEASAGWASWIWGRAEREFLLRDSTLFVAPPHDGVCRVRVRLDGQIATLDIAVEASAPARRPPERIEFPPDGESNGPYLELARHYAPVIAQETWFDPKSDYLARFDFDGDWRGDNNWDATDIGSSQAYVYYAAMETETHWFLVYNFFHPRDYSDKCVAGTCHENDSEGLILTIHKDGSPWGALQVMETLAHDNIYSYALDRRVRHRVHGLDGSVELAEGSRPVVFVEAGGHGVYSAADFRSGYRFARDEFVDGVGVTYVYRGRAERPRHPNDRQVGYQLLPIYQEFWLRSLDSGVSARTFDDYFEYRPEGHRPRPRFDRLAGAFRGREKAENKAKPFWGWRDRKTDKKKVLAVGQWGLDPAYAVSRNLGMPEPFSLEYLSNPYLGIGPPPQAEPEPPPAQPSWRGWRTPGAARPPRRH